MIPADLLASYHVHARPELAALAVLSAAIEAASASLWHQHPEHDWVPEPPGDSHLPIRHCHIAHTILILAAELQQELDRYWMEAGGNQLRFTYDPDESTTLPF